MLVLLVYIHYLLTIESSLPHLCTAADVPDVLRGHAEVLAPSVDVLRDLELTVQVCYNSFARLLLYISNYSAILTWGVHMCMHCSRRFFLSNINAGGSAWSAVPLSNSGRSQANVSTSTDTLIQRETHVAIPTGNPKWIS